MSIAVPDKILQRLRSAQSVVVLTGGGMAAESGIPSFREAQIDEWMTYDVSELATPQAFARNPRLVWRWYEHRRRLADAAEPSPAHYALVDLEQFYPKFTLITQTIDGLHWRAGSRDLLELNGCLRRSRCYETGEVLSAWEETGDVPPHCPHCGSLLRPDVVMFGEGLPHAELRAARQAVETCDLFLCVGSVGAIEPIASFPFVARRVKALVVTIAPEDTLYSLMADHVVNARPGEVMTELARLIIGAEQSREAGEG
jgi:NAD-dependent deacetylase